MPARSTGLLHSVGFKCALALFFLRFSDLHEMLASLTNTSAYLLYVFAPLAILAVIFSGRVARVFRERPAQFWLAFVVWMILAVPLSSWRGGSFTHVLSYVKSNFILLPLIASLATKWSDCRKIIYIIAAAAVFDLAASYFFLKSTGDRLELQWSGTIGNSNDLAAHLLVVLPFLLFVALKPRTRLLFRFALFAAIAFGAFQILRTGSRGALIALVATILFMLVRGSNHQKLVVGVAAVALVIMTAFLPDATWTRLTSFSKTGDASEEARQGQKEARVGARLASPSLRPTPGYERIARGQIPCFPGERMPLGSIASLIVSVNRRSAWSLKSYCSATKSIYLRLVR